MFALGIAKGKVTKKSKLRSAGEVLIIGGIAAAIGVVIGLVFKV
jgi:VIT1/CCC1 family predicted Fe2+/Mn2+ transporter